MAGDLLNAGDPIAVNHLPARVDDLDRNRATVSGWSNLGATTGIKRVTSVNAQVAGHSVDPARLDSSTAKRKLAIADYRTGLQDSDHQHNKGSEVK